MIYEYWFQIHGDLLSHPPECWHFRLQPPHLAFKNILVGVLLRGICRYFDSRKEFLKWNLFLNYFKSAPFSTKLQMKLFNKHVSTSTRGVIWIKRDWVYPVFIYIILAWIISQMFLLFKLCFHSSFSEIGYMHIFYSDSFPDLSVNPLTSYGARETSEHSLFNGQSVSNPSSQGLWDLWEEKKYLRGQRWWLTPKKHHLPDTTVFMHV